VARQAPQRAVARALTAARSAGACRRWSAIVAAAVRLTRASKHGRSRGTMVGTTVPIAEIASGPVRPRSGIPRAPPVSVAAQNRSLTASPSSASSREADAPRPRPAARGRTTVAVPAGRWIRAKRAGAPAAEAPLRSRSRPATKAELDNALHGSGLALGVLLEALDDGMADADVGTRLRRMIRDADVDPHDVDVIVEGAHVTLVGEVRDLLTRLLVEDLAWSVPSVDHCLNQLAVR